MPKVRGSGLPSGCGGPNNCKLRLRTLLGGSRAAKPVCPVPRSLRSRPPKITLGTAPTGKTPPSKEGCGETFNAGSSLVKETPGKISVASPGITNTQGFHTRRTACFAGPLSQQKSPVKTTAMKSSFSAFYNSGTRSP